MSKHNIDEKEHVVLLGNVIDGLEVVGPFNGHSHALGWVEANSPGAWKITPCTQPAKAAKEVA